MMKSISIKSFAKINLALDVDGYVDENFHRVDMIMSQLEHHDNVRINYWQTEERQHNIRLSTNRVYLPTDNRNLAYKAVELLIERDLLPYGNFDINIEKKIPVAAGLAGGSGNGAAVLHGLNALLELGLTMDQLMDLGGQLGSDVPFSIMGQGYLNSCLPSEIREAERAASCARATGRGTELTPLKNPFFNVVIAKPAISVSTKEVYQNIDNCTIARRPSIEKLVARLNEGRLKDIAPLMENVLESYTLERYPKVQRLKAIMEQGVVSRGEEVSPIKVLMSGSGPTVFALYKKIRHSKDACLSLRKLGYEAYWTSTTK